MTWKTKLDKMYSMISGYEPKSATAGDIFWLINFMAGPKEESYSFHGPWNPMSNMTFLWWESGFEVWTKFWQRVKVVTAETEKLYSLLQLQGPVAQLLQPVLRAPKSRTSAPLTTRNLMASLQEEEPLQQAMVPQMAMPMDGQGSNATSVTSEELDFSLEPKFGESLVWPQSDASSVSTLESGNAWQEVTQNSHNDDAASVHIVRDIVQNIEQGSAEAISASSQSQATKSPLSPRS